MTKPGSRRLVVALLAAVLAAFGSASCDLLRAAPFRVESWNPGRGRHASIAGTSVSVTFSGQADHASTENAFSLTEDGVALPGAYSWDGATLFFSPFRALRSNAEFRISVAADARNGSGVSLESSFEDEFSSKPEDGRPTVVSTVPARGGILPGLDDPVTVIFSEAVDRVSLRDCLSLSPAAVGLWELGGDGLTALFKPLEPLTWGTWYQLSVSAELRDVCGNRMGQPFSTGFSVGVDREPPEILRAEAIDGMGQLAAALVADSGQDGVVSENTGWEKPWRMRIVFSEPVDVRSLESRIGCGGDAAAEVETEESQADVVVLGLSGRPEWGGRFSVSLDAGVEDGSGNATEKATEYRCVFDGEGSRPPRFVGMRLPLAPGETDPLDRDLVAFSVDEPYRTLALSGDANRYPLGVPTATTMELYFELASGASINERSIMESFRFSATNGTLSFSATRLRSGGFEYAAPYGPWSHCALVRMEGTLTNEVDPGVVTFQMAAGFSDSLLNGNPEAQRLVMLK